MSFYMLWLSKVFNSSYSALMEFTSLVSPKDAYNADKTLLEDLKTSETLTEKLLSQKLKDEAKRDFEYCENNHIKIIDIFSDSYPHNLRNSPYPPPLLYYKGTLLTKDEVSISIVGSRKFTEYGKACVKNLSSELSLSGITIISGMAYGIDTFSHIYALKNNGRTIAVLGSGINVIYPSENKRLYHQITENGAVLSEFPLNTPPAPQNFPIRNRIVAGLSLGTLVIEATKKSGTMITARLAAEAGRNIYAIPGQIFSPSSEGTNMLIRDGAKIVTSSKDILEDIYSEISKEITEKTQTTLFDTPILSEKENKIYKALSFTPLHIDKLAEITDLPICEVNSTLAMLEINGYIKSLPGEQYVKSVE